MNRVLASTNKNVILDIDIQICAYVDPPRKVNAHDKVKPPARGDDEDKATENQEIIILSLLWHGRKEEEDLNKKNTSYFHNVFKMRYAVNMVTTILITVDY